MVRVTVAGVAGRMGSVLAKLAVNNADLELVGATEAPGHTLIGESVAEIVGRSGTGVRITDNIEEAIVEADVLLDFVSPKPTLAALEACARHKIADVVGTTGFDAEQQKRIEKYSQVIPIVFAPNMSLGVNLLAKLVAQTAKALGPSYDIEIVEVHHRLKADSPSGTAIMLANAAARARGMDPEKVSIYGRQGRTSARPDDQIAIMSLRGGDVVGEHTVIFAGPGERIELTHRAHSRETFAQGAIRAARWVIGKKPGLYSMMDVLGLNS